MALLKAGCLALRVHGPAPGDSANVLVCLQPAAFIGTERGTLFFGYWGETGMHTHDGGSGVVVSFSMDPRILIGVL